MREKNESNVEPIWDVKALLAEIRVLQAKLHALKCENEELRLHFAKRARDGRRVAERGAVIG